MTYQDQFAWDLARRRGGESEGVGERPVRLERSRETECGVSNVSRLRSRRTDMEGNLSTSSGRTDNDDRHCERSAAIQGVANRSGLPRRSAPRNDGGGSSSPAPTTRHDGWTPEIRVKFLNALANCGNVQSAAQYVQRSRTSAYGLKRRDADFALAWDAALLLARDVATDTLQDRAINGVEEEVLYHGEVVATRRKYDSRLLLAHIARLDKLAENIATNRAAARFEEVTGAIAAEADVEQLVEEPTEAEKRERARVLEALGLAGMERAGMERAGTSHSAAEPEQAFVCTYKGDAPETVMMTRTEAEELADEVEGLVIQGINDAEENAGSDGDSAKKANSAVHLERSRETDVGDDHVSRSKSSDRSPSQSEGSTRTEQETRPSTGSGRAEGNSAEEEEGIKDHDTVHIVNFGGEKGGKQRPNICPAELDSASRAAKNEGLEQDALDPGSSPE